MDGVYRGLRAEAETYGAVIVGGNITGSATFGIDITLLGQARRGQALLRGGARPGDALLMTGTLGEARAARCSASLQRPTRRSKLGPRSVVIMNGRSLGDTRRRDMFRLLKLPLSNGNDHASMVPSVTTTASPPIPAPAS